MMRIKGEHVKVVIDALPLLELVLGERKKRVQNFVKRCEVNTLSLPYLREVLI